MNDLDYYINDTVHIPEEGTHKYRDFWGAYKGHVLGLMRGTLSGGILGAVIGAGFLGVAALAGLTFAAPAMAIVAAFSVLGIFVGGDIMGRAGYSAGVAAADKAETELRMRYPGSGTGIVQDPSSPSPGEGHHYEVPPERDEGKWFHIQTGIPMTILGIAVGGLIATALSGLGGLLVAGHMSAFAVALLNPEVVHAAGEILTHTPAAASMLTSILPPFLGGMLGLSYGVNRARFKDVFNPIDRALDGGLIRTRAQTLEQTVQLGGQEQELTQEAAEGKANGTINTIQRQEESHRLFYDYFERSFWRSVRDSIKGSLGGGLVGGTLGTVIGAASFLTPLAPFGAAIMITTMGLGAHEGMKIFTETGMRSGATSAASDLQEVKRQRIQKGIDPEVEMPDGRGKDKNFNFKRALVGVLIGAVIGMALFTVIGPLVLGMTGATFAVGAGSGLAGLATVLFGTAGVPLLVGGTVGGLTGAVSGISSRTLKNIAGLADSIYDGRILKGDIRLHQSEPCRLPYLSPSSPWLPREGPALEKALRFTTEVSQPVPYQGPNTGDFDGAMRESARGDFTGGTHSIAPTSTPTTGHAARVEAAQQVAPARPYPVSAPMGDRIQHLIQEREKSSASAKEREDNRIQTRTNEPAVLGA